LTGSGAGALRRCSWPPGDHAGLQDPAGHHCGAHGKPKKEERGDVDREALPRSQLGLQALAAQRSAENAAAGIEIGAHAAKGAAVAASANKNLLRYEEEEDEDVDEPADSGVKVGQTAGQREPLTEGRNVLVLVLVCRLEVITIRELHLATAAAAAAITPPRSLVGLRAG
jgi:hypothetical protein